MVQQRGAVGGGCLPRLLLFSIEALSFGMSSVRGSHSFRRSAMGLRTGIEWTDATWNPVTGCTKVTAGCDHCLGMSLPNYRLHHIFTRQRPVRGTAGNRVIPFALAVWSIAMHPPRNSRRPRH